ncbi:MAG: hypothetical protein GX162_09175 [Firmicutes bacterium]|nr:hypothetical protein [Bacillota bacterium]
MPKVGSIQCEGEPGSMHLMPIEYIPDWERRIARHDACWHGEIIDRPVVMMTLRRPNPDYPRPTPKSWPSLRDRWLDTEYQVTARLAAVMNTEYLGDALPHVNPNLGPEVFSAFFGAELEFGESTSWSVPNLHSWADADKLQFDPANFYWRKLEEMTDAFLEAGQGRFYTGLTDIHPGGDAIAAFRDPMALNIDLIENKAAVMELLERVNQVCFYVYDYYFDKLQKAGQAICTWLNIVSSKRWYVVSNDFSCMISSAMFDEVFLPGIAAECRHLEASIYHLDGPGALHHLDSLLSIPELSAVQWVWGAGNGRASDWIHVFKKCQAAGKGLWIPLHISELDLIMSELRPQGVWLQLSGVQNREEADAVLKQVAKWR